jgi:hypothetical protein
MKEYVTALPHLTEVKLSERGSCPFMILACDGLWDVMTDQEAVEMVLEEMKSNGPQEGIAEILVSPATLDRALGSSNDRTRWRQPLIAAQVIMSLQLSSIFRRVNRQIESSIRKGRGSKKEEEKKEEAKAEENKSNGCLGSDIVIIQPEDRLCCSSYSLCSEHGFLERIAL